MVSGRCQLVHGVVGTEGEDGDWAVRLVALLPESFQTFYLHRSIWPGREVLICHRSWHFYLPSQYLPIQYFFKDHFNIRDREQFCM